MRENQVMVFIDHAPDWSFVGQSGLSDLAEDYTWKCLPSAEPLRSR